MEWQKSCHNQVGIAWVLLYHHGKSHGMAKLMLHGFCHEAWVLSCCMSYPMYNLVSPWASSARRPRLNRRCYIHLWCRFSLQWGYCDADATDADSPFLLGEDDIGGAGGYTDQLTNRLRMVITLMILMLMKQRLKDVMLWFFLLKTGLCIKITFMFNCCYI